MFHHLTEQFVVQMSNCQRKHDIGTIHKNLSRYSFAYEFTSKYNMDWNRKTISTNMTLATSLQSEDKSYMTVKTSLFVLLQDLHTSSINC